MTYGACCVDDFTARALGCDFLVNLIMRHVIYVFDIGTQSLVNVLVVTNKSTKPNKIPYPTRTRHRCIMATRAWSQSPPRASKCSTSSSVSASTQNTYVTDCDFDHLVPDWTTNNLTSSYLRPLAGCHRAEEFS